MLYHPNSPYYRQFLSASSRRTKKVDQLVGSQAKTAASMPNVNPGSVGMWPHTEFLICELIA